MKYTFILFFFMPFFMLAQVERNYLEGAVNEVNGKVVFTKEIGLPGMPANQIYDLLYEWASNKYNTERSRIVYSDKEKGDIAIIGEDYLVFSSAALSLDRSLMTFRLTISFEDGLCKMNISNIRYEYNVSYQREPERYNAEGWITDKQALTKGKLNRMSGKFRKGTIDYIEDTFEDAIIFISKKTSTVQQTVPVVVRQPEPVPVPVQEERVIIPVAPIVPPVAELLPVVASEASLDGYRKVSPDRLPGNIIKMLSEDWMLITAGNDDEFNMMTASWGGIGVLFEKPVAICYINPKRYTYQLMEKNETYTFTFYTEAYRDVLKYCGSTSGRDKDKVKETGLTPVTTPEGSKAFAEAWMIIECRKMITQPFTTDVMNDPELKQKWSGKDINTMFIGEILNVWIK